MQFINLCQECGDTAVSKCTRCHYAYYCGSNCQRSNWPVHKPRCKKELSPKPVISALVMFNHTFGAFATGYLNSATRGNSSAGMLVCEIDQNNTGATVHIKYVDLTAAVDDHGRRMIKNLTDRAPDKWLLEMHVIENETDIYSEIVALPRELGRCVMGPHVDKMFEEIGTEWIIVIKDGHVYLYHNGKIEKLA